VKDLVKCPKCGMEYSLGTRIYHSCEGYSLCHGVVFGDDRVSRPWNCNPIEEFNQPEVKIDRDSTYRNEKVVLAIK